MNEIQNFQDVKAYSAGNLPASAAQSGAMQTQNQYFTAVRVQVPRDIEKIRNDLMKEARLAKDKFYYSIKFNSKKGGKVAIEGPSIGMVKSVLREFGNCVVETDVETRPDCWIFKAYFIDLEKGYSVSKLFRQPRATSLGRSEKMAQDPGRLEQMSFQIGQSKAIRNVGLVALPSWLISDLFDEAKKQVKNESTGDMGASQLAKALDYFRDLGIQIPQLEIFLEKKGVSKWGPDEIAKLRELAEGLKQKVVSIHDIFPAPPDHKEEKVIVAEEPQDKEELLTETPISDEEKNLARIDEIIEASSPKNKDLIRDFITSGEKSSVILGIAERLLASEQTKNFTGQKAAKTDEKPAGPAKAKKAKYKL